MPSNSSKDGKIFVMPLMVENCIRTMLGDCDPMPHYSKTY